MQETQEMFISGSGRSPGGWQPTPVFWPGKSHGQRSLEGYSPRGCQESYSFEQACSAQHSLMWWQVGLGALLHKVIQRLRVRLSNVFVILGALEPSHGSTPASQILSSQIYRQKVDAWFLRTRRRDTMGSDHKRVQSFFYG